jgi:hypothetical protein
MKFEHRGKTIELFLVGMHQPNYLKKVWEEARAVWKTAINDEEYCRTDTGNREEVLEK